MIIIKKKALFFISAIGSVALIAGVTSIVAIDSIDHSKKANQIDNKTTKQVVNKLNTFIKNPIIIIHSYLTANQALQSLNRSEVKQLIKDALLKELRNEKFSIGNVIFSAKQLIDYISIELPTNSVSYSDFINGQITGVHLVFVGPSISLELMHQGSVNYTIKGFSVPNKNIASSKNIANQLNSVLNQYIYVQGYTNIIATNAIQTVDEQIKLKTDIKNAIKTQIINSNTTFVINGVSYTANEIVNKIDISLPTNVSVSNVEIGQIANVKLSYNGVSLKNTNNTNSFIVEGFEPVNENELNNSNIIKLLNSLLSNIIDVSPYYSMNTTSAADSLNNVALLDDAINSAIETEINSSINKFNFNGISYNANQIIQGISIKLPKTITLQDDEAGQIPGVSLLYNGTYLKASNGNSTFIVDGFLKVSSSQAGYNPGGKNSNTNRNHQVANKLDSYLSQIINISKQTNIASMTAADALNAETSDNLKAAIIKAIQNEIGSNQFTFDGLIYTAKEIGNGIDVSLPNSISLQDDENAQIPGVTLSYNGISLTWKNTGSSSSSITNSSSLSNTDFIIEGFTKVSATQAGYNPSGQGNNTNRNHQIASKLDSLLNQYINVKSIDNMGSYTAADALNDYASDNLKAAIIKAIQNEIGSDQFTFAGIAYTASEIANNIVISLPKSISITDDENAQIPNVALSYNGIALTWKNTNSSSSSTTSSSSSNTQFIVEGFTPSNSQILGKNNNRNQSVANELDSLLNQIINVGSIDNMSSYTAADALNDEASNNLKQAVIEAIENEISSSISKFTFNSLTYTAKEIGNGIDVSLPNSISLQDDETSQIPGVILSYNGIRLTPKISLSSTSNSSLDTFILDGFAKASATQAGYNPGGQGNNTNRNHQIASQLDLLLNQYINVKSIDNMGSYTAADALNDYASDNLKAAIIKAIQNEIGSDQFTFDGIAYTASQIANNIDISLPKSISATDDENAQIPGVELSYNGISLTWKNTSSSSSPTTSSSSSNTQFIVEGFTPSNSQILGKNNNRNQSVANELDSLLNQIINVGSIDNMSSYTAADALNDEASNNLKQAVIEAIENEISSSISKFTFNSLTYTAKEIGNGIDVSLPNSISLQDDENAQIPGVKLSYNGISLTWKNTGSSSSSTTSSSSSPNSDFIIEGFSKVSAAQAGYNPGGQGNNTNRNHQIANELDSYLNQIINISEQTDIASMTAGDALNNQASDNLKAAIIKAIEVEIANQSFNIDGISYTASEIGNGIQITLPSNILLVDDENGQIPGVTLSYNGISLTWKNSSSSISSTTSSSSSNTDFIVEGFSKVSATQAGYNPGGQGNNTNRNHQIASKLDSLLNQYINVKSIDNMGSYTAADALNDYASDNLKAAIIKAIQNQIGSDQFTFDGIAYTASQIANNINISLPKSISQTDDENAQIPGVTLSYNGISLTWKNSSSSISSTTSSSSSNTDFIVEGFTPSNAQISGKNNNRNQSVANELDSLLNQIINVGSIDNMSSYTAADALNDEASNNLKQAVIEAIENEISSSISKFTFNSLTYTAKEIGNGIDVSLPNSISLQDDENAQIPGVKLSYNDISLTWKNTGSSSSSTTSSSSSSNTDFIIEGFSKVSAAQAGYNPGGQGNNTNRNHQIADELDSYLNQIINISEQTNIASMTAGDALNNQASDNLKAAIIKAIEVEIANQSFNIDGISYTASEIGNGMQITLPSNILLADDENGQIPGVTLSYNGISLTWKNTSSSSSSTTNSTSSSNTDFIVDGFTKASATQAGYNPGGQGNNTNRNHQIASKLDSLLNQVINVVNEYNMNSYSAADALYAQSTDNLLTAITNAIQNEIEQSGQLFNIDGIAYTVDQIVNGINIQLPQTVTLSQNASAQIPNVALSYNDISLTPKSSSSTSENYFIIEGFMPTSATQAGYNPTKNNYQIYLENAITKWTASNEGVLNPDLNGTLANSSFNDLVKQNMAGYEILNDSTSFSNIKVSFTQLSSEDANSLGEFASDYWLTITATAINQINFTSWNASLNDNNGGWGTNTVESVPSGTIFTWTLPYALSTLTNNGNSLSLSLNNTYSNAASNESLYVPFGLSIGKTSNLTSISSKWTYNYHGVIATNFGTNGEDYVLPSKWTVAYSQSSNTLNRNQLIANLLDSFLDQTIDVSSYDGMEKMSAADALNNQNTDNLISAITSAIQNEIQNSKETFNIDSIAYTISEIASGIQIKLPADISLNDNETGEITGVVLNYNNISLTPKNSSSSSFTVVGFLPTSSTQTGYNPGGQGSSTNRNHQIASKLDSYLSQIINVSKQDNMSSMSAADALNNQTSDNLKQAITAAIENEIGSEQFNIDGITYTAAEIASSIQIDLPTSISLTAAESGQIPNVTLSYNNISLKANNGQSTFIIEGFEQNTIDQINKIIANTLGSYIKNPIVLNNNFVYTVLDCLSDTTDARTLTAAIMSTIGNELSSSTNLIINSIQLNWSEIKPNLQISLPQNATSQQWMDGELSNVTLTYDSYTLHPSSNSSSNYEVTNLAKPTHNDLAEQIDQLPKLLAQQNTFPIVFYNCPYTADEFIGLSWVRKNWVLHYLNYSSSFSNQFVLDGNQQLITYNHITYIGSDIGGYMASGISQEASGLTQQNNEIGYVPGFVTVEMDLCGVWTNLVNKEDSTVLGVKGFAIPTATNNINTFINGVTQELMQQIPSTINLNQQYSLQWCEQNEDELLQMILKNIKSFDYTINGASVPVNPSDILGTMKISLGSFQILPPSESLRMTSIKITPTYQDEYLPSVNGKFKTITITGFNEEPEEYLNNKYTLYMENAILNWLNSNSNVLGSPNSSFTDLIRQNMAGYEILNNYQDFDDFKVSFTQLSSKDATDLGVLANNYWLTITATSTQTIHFTSWNASLNGGAGGWGNNTVETVAAGNLFTWTLPYSLGTIGFNGSDNELSMELNNTYSNATSNENLPVPFGLSIGTSSNLTSISQGWQYEYGGVIATNFGTNGEDYTLPSTWAVQLSAQNAVANLINAQIANNDANFGNSGQSASTFLTNLISEWMAGFKLNVNSQDFNNWYVSWEEVNGYNVLVLSAYSTINIEVDYYDAKTNSGSLMSYEIPLGSYFSWTLPYNFKSLSFTNSSVSLGQIPYTDYFNSIAGKGSWSTPLGLSIGSSMQETTSISNNSYFTTVYSGDSSSNGVIGIGYGGNNTSPSLSFNTLLSWTSNAEEN